MTMDSEKLSADQLNILLNKEGASVLRLAFDQFNSSDYLKVHLQNGKVRLKLQQLYRGGFISKSQWTKLYPENEIKEVSSENFDFGLLLLLLQHICHFSAPYPNGWNASPEDDDQSLSANIVRIKLLQKAIENIIEADHLEEAVDYGTFWTQMVSLLRRLEGENAMPIFDRISHGKWSQHIDENEKVIPKISDRQISDSQAAAQEAKDSPQTLQAGLMRRYMSIVTKCQPVPWNCHIQVPLSQFYQVPDITDTQGERMEPAEIVDILSAGRNQNIWIQGCNGVGSTTLCLKIIQLWCQKILDRNQILVYLDLDQVSESTETLEETICLQLLSGKCKIIPADVQAMLGSNQFSITFLLDANGVLDIEKKADVHKLLSKVIYPNSTICLVAHPHALNIPKAFKPIRLHLHGIAFEDSVSLLRNYAAFLRLSKETTNILVDYVEKANKELHEIIAQPLNCLMLLSIFKNGLDWDWDSQLIYQVQRNRSYIMALAVDFCERNDLEMTDDCSHKNVNVEALVNHLGRLAFECLLKGTKCKDLLYTFVNLDPAQAEDLGVVRKVGRRGWQFSNTCVRDYLASLYLEQRSQTEGPTDEHLTLVSLQQVLPYLAGLGSGSMLSVLSKMVKSQSILVKKMWLAFFDSPELKCSDTEEEGHLAEFQLFWSVVNECRDFDKVDKLAERMPQKMVIEIPVIWTSGMRHGLRKILYSKKCSIREITIYLNNSLQLPPDKICSLAQDMMVKGSVKCIKVIYKRVDMLVVFLQALLEAKGSLEQLTISQHLNFTNHKIDSKTWAALKHACQNMANVNQLTLKNAVGIPFVLGHFFQHLSASIQILELQNCSLEQLVVNILSLRIQRGVQLRSLILDQVHGYAQTFITLIHAVKCGKNFKQFGLRNMILGDSIGESLRQMLILSPSLVTLDLTGSSLTLAKRAKIEQFVVENRQPITVVWGENDQTQVAGWLQNISAEEKF